MITKEKIKCFDLLSNSPDYLFKKMYGVKSGEFACGYQHGINLAQSQDLIIPHYSEFSF